MGLHLDPRTIVFFNFIGATLVSLGILSLSRSYFSHIRSLRYWSYATLMQAIGWILVALRNMIPDFLSIVLANIFILSSLASYFNILAKFKHIRIKLWWSFVPVFFTFFTLIYFTYISPDLSKRVICVSVISSIMMLASFIILFYKSYTEKKYAHRFTGFLFGYCASILFVRAIATAYLSPNKDEYLFEGNLINDLLYTSYFINSIFISFGFILMCTDWYLEKKKQSQKELIDSKKLLEETNQIARIGNWEINLESQNVFWSKVIREIHEVPDDFIPTLENALGFYKEGKDRNTITDVVNRSFSMPYTFDVTLEINTYTGNRKWVRSLGRSEFSDGKCKRIFGIFQDVTDEILLKQEISLVEDRFKNAFEHSAIGIALLNKEKRFEVVNKELCCMLGYSKEELFNLSNDDITHPDDIRECNQLYDQLINGEINSISLDKRLIRKDGCIIWIFITVSAIKDTDNNIKQTIAHIRDISERKRMEQNLKESEYQLKEAQKIARLGDYSFNFKTGSWYCSEVIQEISGLYSHEADNLENWKTLIAPEFSELFLDKTLETIRHFRETNKTRHDFRIIRPHDGQTRWVSINGEIEYDEAGIPEKLIGTVQDITDRKNSEEMLEQSEEKYRQIVETAEEGIWLLDKNNKTIFSNKKLCEMLGYSQVEMLNKTSLDFTDEKGKYRYELALYNIKAGCKEKFEMTLQKKCGAWMWARLSICSLLEKDGSYKGALAMVTDITENHISGELLGKSEEKYRNLFKNIPMPIFIWRLDNYKIIEVNKAAIREYGYTKNEFLQKHITDIWTEQEQQKAIEFSEEITHTDDTRISRIWKHRNRFNREILMNLSCLQITYHDHPCVLAMAENVTEKIHVANQLQESYDKIRLLNNHLQSIREEERIHIAREIHDELGQQLTVLKIDLAYLGKTKMTESHHQSAHIEQMIGKVDTAIETVRKIATELRPGILDDLGLCSALEWQTEEFSRKTGIRCKFSHNLPMEDTFSTQVNTTFFRIFQEAMTNVARHAKATTVNIQLNRKDNTLMLAIQDNGVGMPENQKKHSLGILGMKERAAMLDGEFNICSIPKQGTNLTVKIPLK